MKLKKLSKFLPGFLRKPGALKPKPVLTVIAPEPQPAPVPESEPVAPTKAQKILDDVCAFLARYLQCSQNQRTVFALWVLHTRCFSAARSSPYLAIQSSRKLSGKTLCLRLLSLLCSNPALTSGYTASALVKRIHSCPKELPTFLLDESPATLGSRGRSKNPKLRAILVSGFQPGIGYSDRSVECTIYSPKAFASTGPLPESLADCSIPIVLQSLEGPDKSNFERFDLATAQEQAKPLIAALQKWSEKNLSTLKSAPAYKRKDFPECLTSRQQDIVEPLLQLADAVGGDYPARARQALVAMFDDENDADRAMRIQLLRDIRQCFEHHGWPDKLHTSVILAWLHALPSRPWDVDGPITDRTLARLLRPHGIRSRLVRVGSVARGYRKDDFATPWNFLLDNAGKTSEQHTDGINKPNATPTQESKIAGSPARADVARDGVQIPNNQAPCNTVTDAQIDPRIKGILDDPRNYYRQYPDEFRNWIADKVDEYEWPNPADNQNRCLHGTGMHGGYSIPFSCINTPPWNNDRPQPRAVTARSPRFPVTLNRQERIQVALARLYEIRATTDAQSR